MEKSPNNQTPAQGLTGEGGSINNSTETPTSPSPSGTTSVPPVPGTGFYRDAKPGTFGPSEWLDLLIAIQDGRATCMLGLEIIEREINVRLENPPTHQFWYAADPACPASIKARNGELHTLRCKKCGQDSPRSPICRGTT